MSDAPEDAAEIGERMRAALAAAQAAGQRVHVSGTSAAVFADCVIERLDGERVWLQPGNYPGAYTPRINELVLVIVPGEACITRPRGRGRVDAKSLGGALEGVRKLSTAQLSSEDRARVEEALSLLGAISPYAETAQAAPARRRARAKPRDDAPMLPLG